MKGTPILLQGYKIFNELQVFLTVGPMASSLSSNKLMENIEVL
jgi:hypothetical protein